MHLFDSNASHRLNNNNCIVQFYMLILLLMTTLSTAHKHKHCCICFWSFSVNIEKCSVRCHKVQQSEADQGILWHGFMFLRPLFLFLWLLLYEQHTEHFVNRAIVLVTLLQNLSNGFHFYVERKVLGCIGCWFSMRWCKFSWATWFDKFQLNKMKCAISRHSEDLFLVSSLRSKLLFITI